jgi:iron complex transport system ATP-binding protein
VRSDPLRAENVAVRIGRTSILRDVSLCLPQGEVTGILGANGAGKTTLLRVLAGFLPVCSGEVLLDGRPLASYPRRDVARRLGVIPQHTDFTLELSVRDVVTMGRFCHRPIYAAPTPSDASAVRGSLQAMELDALAERPAFTLSGGERQRMFLAQLLAQEPRIVLLDEPTAHLDVKYQVAILRTFRDLAADKRWTAAVVLHDLRLAYRFCDRLAFLRQGTLLASGTPADMADPSVIRAAFDVEADFFPSDGHVDMAVRI